MIPSFIPIVTNSLPVATSVAIAGIPFIGVTLAATYSYYSPLGLPESGTEYQWYADGVAIPGETSTSLLVTGGHLGSLITFGVTPSDGLSYGHEAISVPVGPVADSARFTADAPGLYTDTALTVPVASYGDAVAGWRGGVLVGVQPTLTARPAWGAMPSAPNTPILYYDLGDDVLPASMALPAITSGTLVIAGEDGIWIEDSFNHAGGSWSLGPRTYTGGPAGLLPSLIGNRVLGFTVFAGQLTPEQLQVEVAYWMGKGAPGVWELGSQMVSNPDFDLTTGWSANGAGWTLAGDGVAVKTNTGQASDILTYPGALTVGAAYMQTLITTVSTGAGVRAASTDPNFPGQYSPYAVGATTTRHAFIAGAASTAFRCQANANFAGSITHAGLMPITLNTDPYP